MSDRGACAGRTYLERGEPVVVLLGWRGARVHATCSSVAVTAPESCVLSGVCVGGGPKRYIELRLLTGWPFQGHPVVSGGSVCHHENVGTACDSRLRGCD